MKDYDKIIHSALSDLDKCDSLKSLEVIRVQYFGKNGEVTHLLKKISSLTVEEKKDFGKKLNLIKVNFFENFEKKKLFIQNKDIQEQISKEKFDASLPTRESYEFEAKMHPITHTINEIVSILGSMGLNYVEGPDIEDDFHNFTALNIPKNHPARQMHDTFYLNSKSKSEYLLRTHTSNTQIHAMLSEDLPLYMLSPGRVYRCDSDTTHLPMFTQIEGLVVDEGVTFGDLKGILIDFLEDFFNEKMEVRFRPSYFPFTEPSAEVDIKFGSKGWLEILGCGMVHPNVLEGCNIDTKKYRGFAFGMGVERLAMLYYGVTDIREFYSSNLDFLNQFHS